MTLGLSRMVVLISLRDDNNHSLPGSCKEHPVSILLVFSPFFAFYILPSFPLEILMNLSVCHAAEISVPGYPRPVKLKPLDMKLSRDMLEVIRRTHVIFGTLCIFARQPGFPKKIS